MKFDFQKLLPHFIALIVFLAASCFFGKPALTGNEITQGDILGWQGMAQNAFEYKEKHGEFPLWNTHLFGGMPNYQVSMDSKSVLPDINKIITLGLPKPINFFFLACICFYVLCLVLLVNPYIGIAGGLAFAFSTYNPIIIAAGHDTKMFAIAFMPLLLAGILLIFRKKYLPGLCLAAYAAAMEVGVNHPQITYYFLLIAISVSIAYAVKWIREKEWKHMIVAFSLAALSGGIGVAGSAVLLMPTYEYAKATMRGGKQVDIKDNKIVNTNTSGLDLDYAFSYSNGIAEPLTMLMPNAFGGGSGTMLPENSKVIEALEEKGIPAETINAFVSGLPAYWGGIEPSTSGPVYYGALIVLLAILAMLFVKHPLRWALFAVAAVGIMLSWGGYFKALNEFLFMHLPLYNKFRAPSMAMVIPQFAVPVLAVLTMQTIFFQENAAEKLKLHFKKILFATGGVILFCLIVYVFQSYGAGIDEQIINAYKDENGDSTLAKTVVSGLKADRKEMFFSQILRLAGFASLLIGCIFLYSRKWVNGILAVILIGFITLIDLISVGKVYLNEENFQPKTEQTADNFIPTTSDLAIKEDKDPHYRVFNLDGDRFNESRTSYYHRSVGGYHPAKLRIYQDVIETYLSENPNIQVLNALDTRYFMMSDRENKTTNYQRNDSAYGPAWFVKGIKIAEGPANELTAIGNTKLQDTVVLDKSLVNDITLPVFDTAASISLTKYDNDAITYQTKTTSPQLAVLSEVFYPFGWNAYVDGKKTSFVKANYFMRAISVPAGEHQIEFKFEPSSYYTGRTISFIVSIILLLLFIVTVGLESYKYFKKEKK
jgi:hypothetical protein